MSEENGLKESDIIRRCKIYDYEGNREYWENYNRRLHKDLDNLDWVWSESENRWVYREDIEWYDNENNTYINCETNYEDK